MAKPSQLCQRTEDYSNWDIDKFREHLPQQWFQFCWYFVTKDFTVKEAADKVGISDVWGYKLKKKKCIRACIGEIMDAEILDERGILREMSWVAKCRDPEKVPISEKTRMLQHLSKQFERFHDKYKAEVTHRTVSEEEKKKEMDQILGLKPAEPDEDSDPDKRLEEAEENIEKNAETVEVSSQDDTKSDTKSEE